jgi:predicted AlkP superfamily phosphohydrolase/phosphomutase
MPGLAHAYVGPGAGFAVVSSFFMLFITFALALVALLTWPVKWVVRALWLGRGRKKARARRVIVVGLDGQDPELTERLMAEGKLPHFARLKEQGCYSRLGTTLPAESPVAWSSFQTGCNPGKHRIYDFLVPNRKVLVPELSSAKITSSPRQFRFGKYCIPLGKPVIQVGRQSQPFWKHLGDYGVFSSILRVPITFPPEKFKNGVLLSAMCLPDLKGSQGTYFYYSSDPTGKKALTSGVQCPLTIENHTAQGMITGPDNPILPRAGEMTIPFTLRLPSEDEDTCQLKVNSETYRLAPQQYTPWIRLQFKAGWGIKVYGLVRFMVLSVEPHVQLYMTPIHIDPQKPALPISYPFIYAVYQAKRQDAFATLGVAEDTSALNEGILSEEAFLEQCQSIHAEREGMFFDAMEKTPKGAVVCVFDITDRLQHMFFRCQEEGHPANTQRDPAPYRHTIEALYQQMDDLVGRVMTGLRKDDLLIVLSDHGFKPYRRGVNLNTWLKESGYLVEKADAESHDMLQSIDWSQTQAYAVGFGGIFINQKGREAKGIVAPGEETERIKAEIAQKLLDLQDQDGTHPVKQVYDRNTAYKGPYVQDAPDLVAGFRIGYRVEWFAVTGGVGPTIFEDNQRPWSGDHNMNPPDVPGILFCNRVLQTEGAEIIDIGPTVLDAFGIPIPRYMDGKTLLHPAEAEKGL